MLYFFIMKRHPIKYLLLLLMFLLLPLNYSFATGPSFAEILIVPITYTDNGIVLFKTKYHVGKSVSKAGIPFLSLVIVDTDGHGLSAPDDDHEFFASCDPGVNKVSL